MYRVALVCEGPADRAVIEAILDHHLEDYDPRPIHPPLAAVGGDAGPLGGGWKGVRAWCQQESSLSGGLGGVHDNSDILIIQVDTDVAADAEIGRSKACPPPGDSADEVRALVLQWLGVSHVPPNTVLCVPAMAVETWALVALFPDDESVVPCVPAPVNGECVECRTDIKALLRHLGRELRPKLVVSQDGVLKNQASGYVAQKGPISMAWPGVVDLCGQAARFDAELRAVL